MPEAFSPCSYQFDLWGGWRWVAKINHTSDAHLHGSPPLHILSHIVPGRTEHLSVSFLWVRSLGGEDPLRRDRLPTSVFLGFPCGSAGKESACNGGDLGLILGLRRSPGEGNGYPLQYSSLENSADWVTRSRTWLSDFRFHFASGRGWEAWTWLLQNSTLQDLFWP